MSIVTMAVSAFVALVGGGGHTGPTALDEVQPRSPATVLLATAVTVVPSEDCEGVCQSYYGNPNCEYVGTNSCHTYDYNVPPFHIRASDGHSYWSPGVELGQWTCFSAGHNPCGGSLVVQVVSTAVQSKGLDCTARRARNE